MKILIRDIRSYCEQAGISPSTLSLRAVDDGKFFKRISNGGRCWPETEERIRSYMRSNPPTDHVDADHSGPSLPGCVSLDSDTSSIENIATKSKENLGVSDGEVGNA